MKALGLLIIFTLVFGACSNNRTITLDDRSVSGAQVSKKKKVNPEEEPELEPEILDHGVFDQGRFQLKTDLKQWKLIEDADGIQTYEKTQSDAGLVAFRGEILIPVALKRVASVLVDQSQQKNWVDAYVEGREVFKKSDFEYIQYSQTKVPWPFQNRDFVLQVEAKVNKEPPTILISMKSIEDARVPEVSGIVRGNIKHSYYYLKEVKGVSATKMVVEMEVDPKGNIPLWVVNLAQKSWPHNTLAAIKKLAMKDDLKVDAKIEKFFSGQEKMPVKAIKKRKNKK